MAAAALFSSAQSLFGGSKLSSSYTIEGSSGSGGSGSGSSSSGSGRAVVGLWTVQRATSRNGKAVSIWTFDKGSLPGGGRSRAKLDATVEILKKEVSMLSRLRHPCVLEVVEALEETRTSLTFATEQITSSLAQAIQASEHGHARRPSSRRNDSDDTELDEIEIQKGLLQIGKALQFLHESAKLVHSNLTPEAVIVNAKGDWKLSGFGLSNYLVSPTGQTTRWEFPQYDSTLPLAVQKDFDYLAPEFALDEVLAPSNDMYALGCIIFAIHTKAGPPLHNHGSLQTLRENVETLSSIRASWHRLGDEIQDVLSQLLTRYPSGRMSAASFQSSRYFSSILVSTLRFLDRDSFAAKPREEQASFLKGLVKVLPQFSDKVSKRKILPSLLEETRKNMLVPFLLPCIFYIGERMENDEFAQAVLPAMKPLFSMRDPPQVMMTLLDYLGTFQKKCSAAAFREEVLPLVYNALESENPPILEKALKGIPSLSESLDYTTVKSLLLPKITVVFSKTTSLSVKVTTLVCFKSLVPILDKFTLTEKLVPLLARIKTKEPSVMIATLGVHEQIGLKCDITAIATLVLPQLWAMSITPLLSAQQFARFMQVIKQLGKRVEDEHSRHLAEIKRLEESGAGPNHRRTSTLDADGNGEVDFEALVRGGSTQGGLDAGGSAAQDPFGNNDDLSRFDALSVNGTQSAQSTNPRLSTFPSPPTQSSATFSSPPMSSAASRSSSQSQNSHLSAPTQSMKAASILGARPISAAAYQSRSGFAITPDSSGPPTPTGGMGTLQPTMSSGMLNPKPAATGTSNGSNYNISFSTSSVPQQQQTSSGWSTNPPSSSSSSAMNTFMPPLQPSSSSGLSSYMSPMQPQQQSSTSTMMPSSSSAGIQWSSQPAPTMAPMQPTTDSSWNAGALQPSQASTLAPPPGWNSSGILQPQKKEMFDPWGDLDPMR